MRYGVVLIWCCLLSVFSKAQEYRINYEERQLPELYEKVDVFAEEKKGDGYVRLKNGSYKLSVNTGSLKGRSFTFTRADIYKRQGGVQFTLSINGRQYPAVLQLPLLTDIRYNLYTDSIKPILNYWINIEGVFSNGKVYPLDASFVTISSDNGAMKGMEWIVPKQIDFEKVTFTTVSKFNPDMKKEKTLYIKRYKDPKDALDYEDRTEEDIMKNKRGK